MKKHILLVSSIALFTSTASVVVSCSNSNEIDDLSKELENILNKNVEELFEVDLINDKNLNVYLLFNNLTKYIEIRPKEIVNNWNRKIEQNSDDKIRDLFRINTPNISSVYIPTLENGVNQEIDSIKIKLNLANGPIDEKYKNFDLSLKDFLPVENRKFNSIEKLNLTFESNVLLNRNKWIEIIKEHLKNNSISANDIRKDKNKMNFKLSEDDFKNTNENVHFQNNIFISIDPNSQIISNENSNELSCLIYFSNSKEENFNEVKNKYLYYKLENVDSLFN